MFLVDIIAWSLLIYLTYFTIYGFAIISCSARGRFFDVSKKDYTAKFRQNLTVIIYSHNNSQKVIELIESFKNQDYDPNKYSINILLDNCNDENVKLLEIKGEAKLWRINTDVKPVGQFKALSRISEKIMAYGNTNAFVLLNADCKIKSDFLQKVNTSVSYHPVIVGETLKKKNKFLNRILNLRNKLKNRIINHGRFYSDSGNIIEPNVFVIRQEILEKIKFKKTSSGFEEYEYSINLIKNNIPIFYSSDISVVKRDDETFTSIALQDYEKRYKSLITFKNNFPAFFSKKNIKVKELICSLLYPSNTTFVFWSVFLILISGIYTETVFGSFVNVNYIYSLLILKFLSDIYSMIMLRCNINDYGRGVFLFFFAPVLYVKSVLTGFVGNAYKKPEKKKKITTEAVKSKYEKHTVEASVTNGKQEFPCTMEIIKTDEYSQVVFIFRNKKLVSTKQSRINYALEEISEKLKSHGFAIKICCNCGYFYITESTAAHSKGEKGFCLYENFKNESKEKAYACVWEGCFNIIPSQARNYIFDKVGVVKAMPKLHDK